MGRPRKYHVVLQEKEKKAMRAFMKRTCSSNLRTRCAIILSADSGDGKREKTYCEVAESTGASVSTVVSALSAFSEGGFEKLIAHRRSPNSDVSRLKATGEVQAKIIAKACSKAPEGRARWTLSLLAKEMIVVLGDSMTLSRSTIGRVLVSNDIRPHLSEYWCIPPEEDADFVANMEDVLEAYQEPYDEDFPLWCMDEKPYQILGDGRKPLPMRPGDTEKIDSEYVRNGTVSIFCFIQPHTGRILHFVEPTRTAVDWAEKIRYLVDVVCPKAKKIKLVMDNLNVHSISSLYKAFEPAEARRIAKKLEVHYTPKHGSWLDIAEIGINIMTRECLGRRFSDIGKLREQLDAWNKAHDEDCSKVDWQFTCEDSRVKLKRLYPDIEKNKKERDERAMKKLGKADEEEPKS